MTITPHSSPSLPPLPTQRTALAGRHWDAVQTDQSATTKEDTTLTAHGSVKLRDHLASAQTHEQHRPLASWILFQSSKPQVLCAMQTLPERPLSGAWCKEQNGSSPTWAENQAAAQQLARGARAVSLISGFPAMRTGRWTTSVKEDLPRGVNSPRGCLGSGKKRARA